jgi:predicted nucleic acid-binding protein
MDRALLDTDIYSEILRGVNATVAAPALAYRKAHSGLTLSVITVMEMVKACRRFSSPRRSSRFWPTSPARRYWLQEDVAPLTRFVRWAAIGQSGSTTPQQPSMAIGL